MNSIAYVNDYAAFMTDVGHKSRNTVEAYRRDVVQYITYLNNTGIYEVTAATKANVLTYLISLQKDGKSASTVSRALASLKSFYMYLVGNGNAIIDPTNNLEAPKVEKKLPKILSDDEINALLCAPTNKDNKSIRDKAMLELMYATGIRASELIGLNLNDINLAMSFIRCHGTKKDRIIPIGHAANEALEIYISKVRGAMLKRMDEQALFVNINGERLTRQGFWKIIKHYGETANIRSEITPHTLRHSFAAHLLQNGADLNSIKEMMGHADIASTQMYLQLMNSKLRAVYDRTHPRA